MFGKDAGNERISHKYGRAHISAHNYQSDPRGTNNQGKRERVLYLREKNLHVFSPLNKSGKHFLPSTMYNDYAISERL
ncbi:MAG: hypothetical protein WCX22_11305 [Methanoregula sp.]